MLTTRMWSGNRMWRSIPVSVVSGQLPNNSLLGSAEALRGTRQAGAAMNASRVAVGSLLCAVLCYGSWVAVVGEMDRKHQQVLKVSLLRGFLPCLVHCFRDDPVNNCEMYTCMWYLKLQVALLCHCLWWMTSSLYLAFVYCILWLYINHLSTGSDQPCFC